MKKYNIIYADPPWKYDSGFLKRNWDNHYKTMKPEEIYDLNIEEMADENCVLFLWVTFPKLLEGIKTMESWGFKYRTCAFTWIKKNKKSDSLFWGMGFWTRANSEICLLGVRGKPKSVSNSVHSVVISKIEKHSKKPDEVRNRIVELCGDLPRIELFARDRFDGWDAWGNEVPNEIQKQIKGENVN
jgi:site-specific DNA-methyltransferase (adenine-specific)